MRISVLLIAALAIAGCGQSPKLPAVLSPYRIDIQQGNVVTQEMVDKLKPGLTRSQVRFVLGSPLVVDMFHSDRWDYVYLLQKQGKPDERRRLTVIFQEDKLARLEGDVVVSDRSQEPVKPADKPATKPVQPDVAKPAEKPPVPTADSPGKDNTSSAKPESTVSAGTPAANAADEEKDAPKERGFFGRMLDKIGL